MAGSLVSRFLVTGVALAALAGPAGALELPFGFSGSAPRAETREAAPPVRMAQMSDATVRISQMEDEMRRLTGKVEELSFLVLQLQEQLRKTQEDNEFRFQDLEKKGGGGAAPAAPQRRSEAEPAPSLPGAADAPSRVASATPPSMSDAPSRAPASAQAGGDEIGALIGSGSAASKPAAPAPDQMQVASIKGKAPGELYGLGYNYMLSGDYAQAEQTFRQYTQTYPNASDTPDAQYWLGESLYAQSKYREAAEVFLNAQKAHPQTPKAPEMMLKLGMSLVHLDNRETACITYSEINKRYPNMSANVKRKVQAEEKTARCG